MERSSSCQEAPVWRPPPISHYYSLRNPELCSISTNHIGQAVAVPALKVSTRADATPTAANASEPVTQQNTTTASTLIIGIDRIR